ncbi:MAG: malonyl CoA-acyl carrier protein transacylase, partial [Planctomycetes bacterium]|nr:malonyl CoA-acyl carrier protein transacylase [Planctomycetota bacterium]
GCRAVALPVAGAFHSPFMEQAATGLWPMLEATEFCSPTIPVVSNVDAEYHQDPVRIRVALRQQIVQPVLWQRCVERMIRDGVDRFVEIGPGRVLTGLVRKISRKMPAVNVSTRDSIAIAIPTGAAT